MWTDLVRMFPNPVHMRMDAVRTRGGTRPHGSDPLRTPVDPFTMRMDLVHMFLSIIHMFPTLVRMRTDPIHTRMDFVHTRGGV